MKDGGVPDCAICWEDGHATTHCSREFCSVCLEDIENCDAEGHETSTVTARDLFGTPEQKAFIERHEA